MWKYLKNEGRERPNNVIWEDLKRAYEKNIERYVKEHKGRIVLLDGFGWPNDIHESFFRTKLGLYFALKERKGSHATYPVFFERIPKRPEITEEIGELSWLP